MKFHLTNSIHQTFRLKTSSPRRNVGSHPGAIMKASLKRDVRIEEVRAPQISQKTQIKRERGKFGQQDILF